MSAVTPRNLRKHRRCRPPVFSDQAFAQRPDEPALARRLYELLGEFDSVRGFGEPVTRKSNSSNRRVCRRLVAIFAADVAGYSHLMRQDELGTMHALVGARTTMGCLIVEHGGRIANIVGDSVLAEFPSVCDAVECAVIVQERLARPDAEVENGVDLPFRIAVHVGEVIPSGTDIFGDGINVCARLQEIAEPRGICISGAAYQCVRKSLRVAFDDLGERTLKNIDEPVRVFAIRLGPIKAFSSRSARAST